MPIIPVLLTDSQRTIDYKIRLARLVTEQEEEAAAIRTYRDYYRGDHELLLDADQRAFLSAVLSSDPAGTSRYRDRDDLGSRASFPPVDNKVAVVVDKLAERLDVTGFAPVVGDDASITEWLWELWRLNGMERRERQLYRAALVDAEAYIEVGYDGRTKRTTFHVQEAWDGESGVRMFYRDPQTKQEPLYATKWWWTSHPTDDEAANVQRCNLYTANAIYKYARLRGNESGYWTLADGEADGDLTPIMDPGDTAWPIPWTDPAGQPLGLAIVPFTSPFGSVARAIIGPNNALNKTNLDILANADQLGFGVFVAKYESLPTLAAGDDPAGDGLGLRPGRVLETTGDVTKLPADDMAGLLNTARHWTVTIASNSSVPLHHLIPLGGEVPSGAALQMLEAGLVAKVDEAALWFGAGWEEVAMLAQRLERAFGPGRGEPVALKPVWAPTKREVMTEKIAEAEGKSRLGVPKETLWAEMGYDPERIALWLKAEAEAMGALIERQNVELERARLALETDRAAATGMPDGLRQRMVEAAGGEEE